MRSNPVGVRYVQRALFWWGILPEQIPNNFFFVQVIWRQAMQYHNMLKQKQEMEQKQAAEQAAKRKAIEEKVKAYKSPEQIAKEKAEAAEKAAADLLKQEEREKESKTAFAGGVKKGFLDGKNKKKK